MFSERFKLERKKMGLTQVSIAKKLKTSRQNITNWETGYSIPSIELLTKCAELFDCSTDYLLGKSNYKNLQDFYMEHQIEFQNDLKVLRTINKQTSNELDLDLVFLQSEEDINNNIELPKIPSEILLDKLKEMGFLSNNKEMSDKELNVIIEFIENNKSMLKEIINKEMDKK